MSGTRPSALVILLPLAFAAVLTVSAEQPIAEPTTVTEPALPAGVKEHLRQAVERSQAAFEAADAQSGLVEVIEPGLPFGAIRGYDADRVDADAEAVKASLIGAFADESLSGLQAYVDEFYPLVNLRTVEVHTTPETECSVQPCPTLLAEPGSVLEVYRNIQQFTSKVSRASAYKISFDVTSVPDGARFTIQPVAGGQFTEVATNGPLGTIFRGLYRYTVERSGYKTASAVLNLVDNTPRELVCNLVSATSDDEPLPCLFGVIE